MDDVLFWEAGPEGAGVYVGELDGQPITAVGVIQHNDTYAWVGFYFCEEEYRGKGYAFNTWTVARAAVNPTVNLGIDACMKEMDLKKPGCPAFSLLLYLQFLECMVK